MTTANIALWNRIDALAIGPEDASLSFSRRLARENGWTLEYAEAVVAEYKKFIYLVAFSGEELTPSDQVDQAWNYYKEAHPAPPPLERGKPPVVDD